jgi:hypothetical protein
MPFFKFFTINVFPYFIYDLFLFMLLYLTQKFNI